MIEIKAVSGFGQISEDDVLLIEKKNGSKFVAQAKIVLNKATNEEEIVIGKKQNHYFIMSMYLSGESWVKNCSIFMGAKITSITNTTKSFTGSWRE